MQKAQINFNTLETQPDKDENRQVAANELFKRNLPGSDTHVFSVVQSKNAKQQTRSVMHKDPAGKQNVAATRSSMPFPEAPPYPCARVNSSAKDEVKTGEGLLRVPGEVAIIQDTSSSEDERCSSIDGETASHAVIKTDLIGVDQCNEPDQNSAELLSEFLDKDARSTEDRNVMAPLDQAKNTNPPILVHDLYQTQLQNGKGRKRVKRSIASRNIV